MKKTACLLILLFLLCSMVLPVSADKTEVKITMQPQNLHYPEYSVASYTVKASGSNLQCTWYLEYEGKTYNISDNYNGIEPWEGYAGETYGGVQEDSNTFVWFFSGIEAGLNGAEIWCVIEDGHYSATSDRAIITVQGDAMPPVILDLPAAVTAYRGNRESIRCVATAPGSSQLEYTWYESSTGKLQDIRAITPEETADFLFFSTESVGTRYYVCGITTSQGGRAYSSVVPVTVLDADPEYSEEMEILTKSLPDAVVGQEYSAELKCNDPYGLFTLYYNPGGANQLEGSGLRLIKENFIVGTPTKAGTITFTVCASGDYGEDYWEYKLTVREAPEETEPELTEPADPDASQPDATDPSGAPRETNPKNPQQSQGETKPVFQDETVKNPDKDEKSDGNTAEFPWWGFALIAVAAAAAGAGAAILIVKRKK